MKRTEDNEMNLFDEEFEFFDMLDLSDIEEIDDVNDPAADTDKVEAEETKNSKEAVPVKNADTEITHTKAAPNNGPKAAPTNGFKTAPTNVPKAAPNNVPKTAPTNVPKTAPNNGTKAAPNNGPKVAPKNASKDVPSKGKKKSKKKKTLQRVLVSIPVLICVFFAALLALSLRWALSYWANLTMDEIVYHLTSPLEGTGEDVMMKFYLSALIPAILILLIVTALLIIIGRFKRKWFPAVVSVVFGSACIVTGIAVFNAWTTLDIGDYVKNQGITSSFIEDNYVDPKSVPMTFPEKKRNLIFIYLESLESTFTDKEHGGGFEFNCIPELTELAQKYEDFSGPSPLLNGGHVLPGTTFTMGGMFGQTSGLPLQVGLKAQMLDDHGAMNEMYTQEHFFPGITTLGDVLDAEGYHNVLFIGTEAVFGGRKLYFEEHGNYEMDDYNYAVERNWLKEKENPWGYGDWRLFLQAKERLKELSAEDEPFNFTMLTLDTHFEDGFRCKYCQYEFLFNGYADVFACSSRQLTEFVSWCQEQDWYENTTIILSGDHTTMDSDFCDDVAEDYPRKTYTCYINADAEVEDPSRTRSFTTLDNFPTTLAAMGVKIEGNRLGLGTNLYSAEDTLYEQYGDEMDTELNRRSLFMEQASEFDPNTEAYKKAVRRYEASLKDASKVDESAKDDSSVPAADGSVTDESGTASDEAVPDDSSLSAMDSSGLTDSSTSSADESLPADSSTSSTDESLPADSSTSSADESSPADSSISSADESLPADSSTSSADESSPADSSVVTVGETAAEENGLTTGDSTAETDQAVAAPSSPFPNDTVSLYDHLEGKGVAGSNLYKDIMFDPWKSVTANLTPGETTDAQDMSQ